MWVWLDRVAPLLIDASLAAAVLTSVFLAILLVCLQPAKRIALARTAILGVLAITPLTALAPWPRFHIVHTHKRSPVAPRQIFVRRASSKISIEDTHKADRDAIAMIPIGDDEDSEFLSNWLRVADFARRPVRLIVLTYLVIVCLGLAWGSLGYAGIWWLIRGSSPPSPQTLKVFDSIRTEAGKSPSHGHHAQLRISDRVARPVVVALLHPTILLPPQLDLATTDENEPGNPESEALLRLSLLHELAHVGRHDASFQLVGTVAQAIWFFLPQLWWIRSQLRLDQEFLADHVACRSYGTSSQYASSLLDLAASHPAQRLTAPAHAIKSRPSADRSLNAIDLNGVASSLGQRLLMLLHCPYRLEPRAPVAWLWGMRIVGVAATFALANVSVRLPGMAYGSPLSPSPSIEGVFLSGMNRFQVSELIIEPSGMASCNRSDSYVVPCQLPAHFSMTLDVLATQTRLSHIRLMNLPLAQIDPWTEKAGPAIRGHVATNHRTNDDSDRELWHCIRIDRDDHGISLSVDHHSLPCPAEPTNSLIRVDPEIGKPVELRNLIVTPTS